MLSLACQNGEKDKYSSTVDAIVSAAKQIREEVAAMEVDILVGNTMADLLEKTKPQMDSALREVQLSVLLASSKCEDSLDYNYLQSSRLTHRLASHQIILYIILCLTRFSGSRKCWHEADGFCGPPQGCLLKNC